MQIIVLRGLFYNWKQPIYMDFDTTISKDIVFKAINKAHASGYNVVACVSDMSGENYGLWNKLNVSIENPADITKEVFLFADTPHLLKLLQNWFVYKGFLLDDNVYVDKSLISVLIELDSNELKVCHKLNKQHFEVVGAVRRQYIKLVVQLFQSTTAKALELYKLVNDENIISNLSAFIVSLNDWFDVMNSYVPQQSLQLLKCGYGLYEVDIK
uniref:Transposable element P transposase n=1 Tax=Clastoptera arizonana TaxID=38151 RepID=A0A1B6EB23_9HEMI